MANVKSQHPLYESRSGQWERARDAFEGTDTIKGKGEVYLPRPVGWKDDKYKAYKARALWSGHTERTVLGLTGMVFRKPLVLSRPDTVDVFEGDLTLYGTSLNEFAMGLFTELLITGRYGVLVDFSNDGNRPFIAEYPAENIVNWRVGRVNGKIAPVLIVLKEMPEVPIENKFDTEEKEIEQFRVLSLEDGKYIVRVMQVKKGQGGESATLKYELIPTLGGREMEFIPFQFFGVMDNTSIPQKPPILDLVDVNISHYQTSADIEHGRHFTALPTPWAAGFKIDGHLEIGSTTAWVSSDPSAKAGMLEYTGQGLGALREALEGKERLMAILGARLLEQRLKGVEAAESIKVRQSGEQSIISSMAESVNSGINRVLRLMAQWSGFTGDEEEINIQLNKDFLAQPISAQEAMTWATVWQTGAISYETMYHNLEKGEATRPGVNSEQEKELIEMAFPLSESK